MGFRIIGVFVFSLLISKISFSQVYVQKYKLEKLSFQYRSNNLENNRCLKWFPMKPNTKVPLQYTKIGEPFLTVVLRARVEGECELTFENGDRIKEVPSAKPDQKSFEVRVTPPVTVVSVQGPNFVDELVIEAPLKEFEDVGFFSYFSKSQVYFDLKYTTISTNNPESQAGSYTVKIVPVLGGFLTIPVPLFKNIFVGLGMSQNLGNFLPEPTVPVQVSEIAFDLRFSWTGRESSGRPTISIAADYRGKNLYQTASVDINKPFLLGSIALPGVGVEAAYYMGQIGWGKRFGLQVNTRFYPYGLVGGRRLFVGMYEGALNFRLDKKWALGFGATYVGQTVTTPDFVDLYGVSSVTEKQINYFMRLSLVPFIDPKVRR